MQSLFFWNSWNKTYRAIWYVLLGLFVLGLLSMWYGYFQGHEGLTEWNKYQEQKTIEDVTHTFEVGNFEFVVPIDSYATYEYFNAGPLEVNIIAPQIFVIVLVLMSIVLLSVITTFSKFWYFIATGLFILFLVSLRLDVLEIFGYRNQIPTIISAVVFVTVSFYFNAFNKNASFTFRLLAFTILTAILAVIIYFFSAIEYPLFYLGVSSYIPALILTVIFIFMIAHEIIAGFVYLTSQSTTSSKNLQHFIIITLIYIVSLVLTYAHEAGFIEWSLITINLYLLLTISAVLTIWGFRRREPLYGNVVAFYPFGAYLILAMAVIALSATAMFLITYNDAAFKIIRDAIIFSHIGFGAIFLLYFVSNFIGMMAESRNVHKVLYNPTTMPYATYRIAGLIATFAFVFYSQFDTYVYYGTAGIFNSMGDVQQHMDKQSVSESYYLKSRDYAVRNFHSNYILAGMQTQNGDFEKAHSYYNTINWSNPTQSSIVNDANLYLLEKEYLEASFKLEAGLKVFPKSGILKNNLGYMNLKKLNADTAFILFDQSKTDKLAGESAQINITGLLAEFEVPINVDSLVRSFNNPSDAILSNALVIASQNRKSLDFEITPLKRGSLNLYSATLLNNYMVNKLSELDTTFITHVLKIANDSLNSDYSEALKTTLAHAYYYQNNTAKAFALLGENAFVTQSLQGKLNYTMGLWALEQGNADLAVTCFAFSVDQSFKEAKTYNAIALAEAGMQTEALTAANTLLESRNLSDREIGKQLKNVLTISSTEVLKQTDLQKYQFCRYRLGLNDSSMFNRIINTLENPNYQALVILEMAKRQFHAGSTQKAIRYFLKLNAVRFSDKNLRDKINHFELELLASRNEVRLLAQKINADSITFPKQKELHKLLYAALISEANGDTISAERNYAVLANHNPFFEEGIIAASRFYKKHSPDMFKAYAILADAKQINPSSPRLLIAYIEEAQQIGFDDFANDALEELQALYAKRR